jgi:hypothetical protein
LPVRRDDTATCERRFVRMHYVLNPPGLLSPQFRRCTAQRHVTLLPGTTSIFQELKAS